MTDKKTAAPASTEADVSNVLKEASQTGVVSQENFTAILAFLMGKEAKLAAKEANLELQQKNQDAERKKESDRYTISLIEAQKNCKHLKGGKGRSRAQQRDPAVAAHIYSDGKIVIKCQLCRAKWTIKDTADYLDRNGSKIPNWTGIGWREALAMAEDSSNRTTSSERFPETQGDAARVNQDVQDTMDALAKVSNLQV